MSSDRETSVPTTQQLPAGDEPEPASKLHAGKVVGDFELVVLLGEGAMGQVWEARQLSMAGRRVAIKFIRPERVTTHSMELLAREARAGGKLTHPGLVAVYAHGASEGLAWIALEHVPGKRSLRDLIGAAAQSEEVPSGHDEFVADFVAQVADAMHAVHQLGVVHRDLKPQNILVTADSRPKVSDFGIARILDESTLSQPGAVAGTFLYMSPQQVKGAKLERRTDVFSLGVVLYEMLTFRRPFTGDTPEQIIRQILDEDPPDPRTIRSKVPRDLAVIAVKALEKKPHRRYQTMANFAADLRRWSAHEPIHAKSPTAWDRCLRWCLRHPTKSVVAAVVGSALVVITALLALNVSKNRDLLRLSAMQDLDDLIAEAEQLSLVDPDLAPKGATWLARAEELRRTIPDHRSALAALAGKTRPLSDDDEWWRAQMEELVAEFTAFADEEVGLLHGVSPSHGWGVARRIAVAQELETATVSGAGARQRWDEARADLAVSVAYLAEPRLDSLPAQFGLLPLGRDPRTGLWEFAHLASGEPAERSHGELQLREETGLVMVLIPSGTSWIGAQKDEEQDPNYDRRARSDERLREESVTAFFLSKFEMTQSQWIRLRGANPSYYKAGVVHPGPDSGETYSALHPVESVSWHEARRALEQVGLRLPTEVEWEYAARCAGKWSPVESRCNIIHDLEVEPWKTPESEDEVDGWMAHAPAGFSSNDWGLCDVIGNVWELCEDRKSEGKEGRVVRGGGFTSSPSSARLARRSSMLPDNGDYSIGVRPAMTLQRR